MQSPLQGLPRVASVRVSTPESVALKERENMKTCKLDLGFFSGEFPSSLVSLAGFSITRTPTGESYADGSVNHQSERDNAPKRVARALSEGITGAAVLLAAIRYAEE